MKKVLFLVPGKTNLAKQKADIFAKKIQQKTNKNIQIESAAIKELFFEISSEKVAIYHPEKKFDLRDFDLVIIRHISGMANEAHAIAQYCENFNIKYTDEYLNRLLPDNKMSSEFLLWLNGIKNIPHTFYGNLNEMKRRFAEFGERAILKDNEGAKGRLNFLVRSVDEIQEIHDTNPEVNFVLQEFIPNNGDLRILILGGDPALVIERRSKQGSHLNNTSQGGSSKLLDIEEVKPEILVASRKAAEVSKLQVAGVDIVIDSQNDKFYILEVNNAPQVSSGSFKEEKAIRYAKMVERINE